MTPTGPSMELDPCWGRPWKCILVVSLPSLLLTLTTTRSPTLALIAGQGHFPFIPTAGRTFWPSGLTLTQVTSQLYVTVAARATFANMRSAKAFARRKGDIATEDLRGKCRETCRCSFLEILRDIEGTYTGWRASRRRLVGRSHRGDG